jgi:pullulanase
MVIDFSDTNPTNWNLVNDTSTFASNTDSTPYELHVRDLTMDDTWTGTEANRGRYAGMWESGTTYTEGATTVSTGFDHIKELGVNTVHILPFFDHNNDEVANAFNWGYNPLNYNVIEGSYSSNPYDGKVRIREAKDMIKAYDSEGIKIVMDVVYNHLGDANGSNFNKLVPGYYFRYGPTGAFSNGSGVGNDTASERYMFRKFMVDSTTFWAEEYKLGGFRFDLMGLHDTTTMKAVRDSLVAIDPDIVMYGEAWNSSTSTYGTQIMANQTNLFSANMTKIGGFSDVIRDAVKGSVFTASEGGWVQAASPTTALRDKLKNTLRGKFSISTDPQRLVNYVSAHDNMTLYDKIFSTGVSVANAPKINLQSSAIITFAQGIPFYHAGDELMRQKLNADGSFNHNSYNAPDSVNSIKWDNKVLYNSSFNKFKEMVALRNEHAIFRNASGADITANYTDLTSFGGFTFTTSTLGYRLTKGVSVTDTYSEVIVLHNGNNAGITVNASGYSVAFSSYGVLTASASMNIPGNTTVVLYA